MSGFLEQIERRQQRMQENMKQAAAGDSKDVRGKTVGVKVPPHIYARLLKVKAQFELKTMKATMLFVAEKGIERVLDGK